MRERDLFIEVLKLEDPVQRREYLSAACGDDIKLLGRVKQLLAEHERQETFILDAPPLEVGAEGMLDQPAFVGTQIGPYKLLQQIGEGGMGVVYMAEQTEPVARRVALKVIKPGMDSRQVIARFEAERQALALMDHPNIARVLDAGTVPLRIADCGLQIEEQAAENPQSAICNLQSTGRPYFVMELVHGVPITQYCDERQLTVRQRMELLVPVCQAIQHAHQKGIIHRDIKPTNVLIALYDGVPVPKVIDFGVAKATGPRLTEKTMFTQFGQLVGTLEYMSPEQAQLNQLDIDTRSDIYSLGVLLYELLTGSTPLDQTRLRTLAFDETLRIIREEEPLRPSTRLSSSQSLPTIAANRGSEPGRLRKAVRGELDWIVMKCLEKDRNRRYESANALGLDLQRYLTDEPVQACPPSWHYRLRKLGRRHKAGLIMGGVVLGILVLAGGGVGWLVRDRAAQQSALDKESLAALSDAETWYRSDELTRAMSAAKRARGLIASGAPRPELLRRARQWQIDLNFVAQLEEVRLTQSAVRDGFFDNAAGDDGFRQAFDQYGLKLETLAPETAAGQIRSSPIRDRLVAAIDHWISTKIKSNRPGREQLVAIAALVDDDPWRTKLRQACLAPQAKELTELARNLDAAAQPASAVLLLTGLLRQTGQIGLAVDVLSRVHRRHPDDFWINQYLGLYRMDAIPPQPADAIPYYRAAVALRPQSPGARLNLGNALIRIGKHAEAEAEYRQALALKREYPEAMLALGLALDDQGRYQEASEELRRAVQSRSNFVAAWRNLGKVLSKLDQGQEAIAACEKAISIDSQDPFTHQDLGDVLLKLERFADAEEAYRAAIGLRPDRASFHYRLAQTLASQQKSAEQEAALREAVRLEPTQVIYQSGLGQLLLEQNKGADAEPFLAEAVRLSPQNAEGHFLLAKALSAQRRYSDAEGELRLAARLAPYDSKVLSVLVGLLANQNRLADAEILLIQVTKKHPDFVDAWEYLGNILMLSKKTAAADVVYQKLTRPPYESSERHTKYAALLEQMNRPEEAEASYVRALELDPNLAQAHARLGYLLLNQNRLDEAEPHLRSALRLNRQLPRLPYDLGALYIRQQRYAEAEQAYRAGIEVRSSDPGLHYQLGQVLYQTGKNREAEAAIVAGLALAPGNRQFSDLLDQIRNAIQAETRLAEARAAVQRDPDDASARAALANVLMGTRRLAEAQEELHEAIRLEPDNAAHQVLLAQVLVLRSKFAEADEAFQRAMELGPESADLYYNRGLVRARLWRFADAENDLAKSLELAPQSVTRWSILATLRLYREDQEGHRAACREMLAQLGTEPSPEDTSIAALVCLLSPESAGELGRAAALADRAVTGTEKRPQYVSFKLTRALADYRRGEFAAADQWLRSINPQVNHRPESLISLSPGAAAAFAVWAMARSELQQSEPAAAAIQSAQFILDKRWPDEAKGQPHYDNWDHWLRARLLVREAEQLLKNTP